MRLKSLLCGLSVFAFSALAQAQTAAYIRGATKPWGQSTNESAMNLAFGAGNWSDLTMAGGVGPFLAGSGYRFIYLEGSDATAIELNGYLTANRVQIEAFVNAGGNLLLNSAPNVGGNINFGFGGVTLTNAVFTRSVTAFDVTHPVFIGPATPVVTSYTGGWFGHAVVGGGLTSIIIGAPGDPGAGQTVLGEKSFGAGCVVFGGMTTDNFHLPQPQAHNLRANILTYGAAGCKALAPVQPVSVPVGGPFVHLLMVFGLAGLGAFIFRRRSFKA